MKHNVYSIYDQAAGLYSRPFFDKADAAAVRAFADLCNDDTHPLGKHPEDYTLFRIGLFNDNDGEVVDEVNESLITGLEAKSLHRNRPPQLLEPMSERSKIENGIDPYNTSPGGSA